MVNNNFILIEIYIYTLMHVVMDLVQDSTDSKDGSVYDAATKLDRETQLKPSNLRHEVGNR